MVDTETGKLLDDHIEWAKFTDAAWWKDGFFYSAYDRLKPKEFSNANENHRIYYHKLGTPQADDKVIFEDKENPLHFHTAKVSDNEKYIFVYIGGQGFGDGLLMKDLTRDGSEWVAIEPSQNYSNSVIDVIGNEIYILTSADAPRNRIVKAPVSNPARANWVTVVPEQEGVLASVERSGNDMILTYEKDASSHPQSIPLTGKTS